MNDRLGIPTLQRMPDTYDARAINDALQALVNQMHLLQSVGRVRAQTIHAADLPTSAVGLSTGDFWWDTGTNTVHIAP